MDKTEPTFVPEWLKNNGTSAATSSHQSLLQSDDQSLLVRRKSLINVDDNDSKRTTSTTSSYFRRASSSNGRLRSYGSFGRRDWDKNKEKYENKYRDFDPLGSMLPSRFEKDGLRRSQSNLSAKRGESWNKKVVGERNGSSNNNGKVSFEKDFPSLGSDEKQGDYEIGRVPSPGLSTAIQSLPVGSSDGIGGGDGWTSALAEVPVMVGPNGPGSVSATVSVGSIGRNMAEALAQGPPRAQTAPQLSVGSQRLEELAVKQSRQLIPMTPSMSKASALNSDKPKPKVGPPQLQGSHIMNHSPSTRPVSVNADVNKSSSSSSTTVGKLHVLKPSRERNGTTITKECASPTTGTKLPKSPSVDRKPLVEKRPSPQAKSRNDFFNLMRKKAMASNNSSSCAVSVDPPELTNDKTSESGVHLNEDKVDLGSDGDVCVVTENVNSNNNNVKDDLRSDVVLDPEEEEARFLRSMGWEETTEEECLTEEEINSFYKDLSKYVNLKTASSFFKGTQLKSLMPLNLLMGKNGEFSADTTKVDS
ncbi:uncharacterized protein LOC143579145 [Bidens hawaiensis]|uniref:uncharacterized protein LOC143579145 n=1 Tax=Bidens hawaiensis TaxID=980011 RepID=UPI0040495F65